MHRKMHAASCKRATYHEKSPKNNTALTSHSKPRTLTTIWIAKNNCEQTRKACLESSAGNNHPTYPAKGYKVGCPESKREGAPCLLNLYKRSSIGRAAVSKTAGRGFDSYRLCNCGFGIGHCLGFQFARTMW